MSIKTFSVILKWAHMVAPGVRHLAFERTDGDILEFIPGQFISIHFVANDKPIKRSYSIATIPGSDKNQLIEIALSFVKGGTASEFLFGLQPGDELTMSGPYGRLILRENEQPKRYILIATGTGVTPYRSMLPALRQQFSENPDLNVHILLGVRTHKEQLYSKDFLEFSAKHPRCHFNVYYSREYPENPAHYEHSGYVQSAFTTLDLDPNKDIIYLCGNPNMIDNAVDLLKEKQFTIQQIRREKYIS